MFALESRKISVIIFFVSYGDILRSAGMILFYFGAVTVLCRIRNVVNGK